MRRDARSGVSENFNENIYSKYKLNFNLNFKFKLNCSQYLFKRFLISKYV